MLSSTRQSAPRAVSAMSSAPSLPNASPFATIPCVAGAAGGCSAWFWRPTPTVLAMVGTRKSTDAAPPAGPTRKTRPWAVPPSET